MVTKFPKKPGKHLKRRRLIQALWLSVIGIITIIILALVQPFHTFNLWFADQFIESGSPSPNVVIAGIDDSSLEEYGKWSEWPRSLHAAAIDNLAEAGATVIGFDVLFAGDSSSDADLAEAISGAKNVVLAEAGVEISTEKDGILTFTEMITPADSLLQSSPQTGHVNILPDQDGKVRKIPLIAERATGEVLPALSLAVVLAHFHQPLPDDLTPAEGRINILSRDIPVDEEMSMRLNYAIMDNSTPVISYSAIVSGRFDPSLVHNKIVIIGITATGDIDTWGIPNYASRIPGIMIHAAAIDTVLRGQFLTETGLDMTVAIMALILLVCVVLLPLFGTWHWTDVLKVTGLIAVLLVIFLVACSLSAGRGYILNVLYPCILLLVILIGNIVYMVVREQSDKRMVKDLFGRYVSPQISQEIVSLANEGELKLGGEEREVTVLFADIRNFTTISESMTPDAVVQMLNLCLPGMIEAITDNDGLVNKFAGDNVMGVWNAPQSQTNHALLAVKAAWEAQKRMADIGKDNPLFQQVKFGIGINTGPALAGNIGSSGRAEYTVIGDAVNLASRICGVAPGGEILVSPETYRQLKDSIEAEGQEPQRFKGKAEMITVYRVTGWRETTSDG